jgi:hypothetical protein
MSKKQLRCIGCEQPTTDSIVVAGQRLPYHPECALEAERDLHAMRDGIVDALVRRRLRSGRCGGSLLLRADEL